MEHNIHPLSAPAHGFDDKYRTMLDMLPFAVYATDPRGIITYYNPAAVQFWGRKPEAGKALWSDGWRILRPGGDPLPPDEYPMTEVLREQRAVYGFEGVCERPDGSRVPFTAFPTPLFDAAGRFAGAMGVMIDITERCEAREFQERINREMERLLVDAREAALLKSHLAAIVESSDDAIVSKNFFGIITSLNAAAEKIFGYTASEAIGKHISIIIPYEHQDEEYQIIDRLRRGERIDHFETMRRTKGGDLIKVSISVSPVRDADGKVIGAAKVARMIQD